MNPKLPPAIFLMGPTASGKTGIAVELAIAAALIYLPGLQEGFGMRPFDGPAWAFLLIPGPSVLLIEEARKWLMRRRPARLQFA